MTQANPSVTAACCEMTLGQGGVGQTPGIAAMPRGPGVGPHFPWALPGVAQGRANEGAGAARGVSGGRAVAAAALSRGRVGKKREKIPLFHDLTGFFG